MPTIDDEPSEHWITIFLTKEVAARIEQDLQPELTAESKLEPFYSDKFGGLGTLVAALDKFFGD